MANQEIRTVAALIEQLQSDDRTKRLSAAGQLADFEGEAKAAIPTLRSWIGSDTATSRRWERSFGSTRQKLML
jgi:hypothetical protein